MNRNGNTLVLDSAFAYHRRGYMPIPVPYGRKGPTNVGWQHSRFGYFELQNHFNGRGNIGVLLGEPSGWLIDVDLDCPEALALADKYLPSTGAETGRASKPRSHRWFVAVGAVSKQFQDPVTEAMIVELRSTGLQTIVGPSRHPDGETYDFLDGNPAVVDAAELRQRVEALFQEVVRLRYPNGVPEKPKKKQKAKAAPDLAGATTNGHAGSADGTKTDWRAEGTDDERVDRDVLRRAIGYIKKIPGGIQGHSGSKPTYTAAVALVHGFCLPLDIAFRVLKKHYNKRCKPPWSDKELRHKIESAAKKSHRMPKGWLRDRIDVVLLSEFTLCDTFIATYEDELRWHAHRGVWLRWDGNLWRPDAFDASLVRAKGIIEAQLNALKADGPLRTKFGKKMVAAAVDALARQILSVAASELDSDPMLLGTPGGTVDLRTGELRPSRPEDMITKSVAVAPAPTADCPLWLKFLDEATGGDKELQKYLQRALFYALTGLITEHVLLFLYGLGGNGKSVFLNTILKLMGAYAIVAAMEVFTESRNERHPCEIADLAGARMVIAQETEKGRRWAEARIKALTGGDRMKGRFMRQDWFEFQPQFKLIFSGNHKPSLSTVDAAMRRRFHMVPFEQTPKVVDTKLEQKLVAEWPQILRWVLDGGPAWREIGLAPPPSVVDATAAYFEAQDIVGQWLDECVETSATSWISTDEIIKSWTNWSEARKADPKLVSSTGLADLLKPRGGIPARSGNIRGYDGVTVRGTHYDWSGEGGLS